MRKFILMENEFFYFSAYFLLCFSAIVYNGSYVYELMPDNTNTVIKYASCILFLVSLIRFKWKIHSFWRWSVFCAIIAVASLASDQPIIILIGLAVAGAGSIDFEKIRSFVIVTSLLCVGIVLFFCVLGVIPNMIYPHDGRMAYSLGFNYYSNLSSVMLMVTTLSLTAKKRNACRWGRVFFWFLVNLAVYMVTTTKLTFILVLAELLLVILIEKLHLVRVRNIRWQRLLASILFPVMAAASILLAVIYDDSNPVLHRFNGFLVGRPKMSHMGFERYAVTLFGNSVEMTGGTEIAGGAKVADYFYIDSAYIYTLLAYGIVVFIFLIVFYSVIYRYAVIMQDGKLFIWCTIICVHSLINNLFMSVELNPLLLLAPFALRTLFGAKDTVVYKRCRDCAHTGS